MKGDILTINNEKYHIKCVTCFQEKVPCVDDCLGLKIGISVTRISDNTILEWKTIKGSYLAEKITDFVENTINGQRAVYWDWEKEVKDETNTI